MCHRGLSTVEVETLPGTVLRRQWQRLMEQSTVGGTLDFGFNDKQIENVANVYFMS